MITDTIKQQTGIALKGGMFTLTSIQLLDDFFDTLSFQLDEKIKQAPNFFHYAPIVLDLQKIPLIDVDFSSLVATLRQKKLIPIGVRGASKTQKEAAIHAGLAIFPEEKVIVAKKRTEQLAKPSEALMESITVRAEPSSSSTPSRLITHPVRSGQQIYVPGGDLVVLASVSHGAELLADGHIHVHGPMRGRGLAGVMGDKDAIIYCRSLEAELVSIAGQYRICDDLKLTYWKEPVAIQLFGERLQIRLV